MVARWARFCQWVRHPRVVLYIALLAPCVAINLAFYPGYPEFLAESAVLSRPASDIFPFTYGSAIALLGFAGYSFYRRGMGLGRAILLAWPLPFAAVSAFEGVYWNVGYLVRPSLFYATTAYGNPWVPDLINASWVALAFVSFPDWRPDLRAVVAVAAFWVAGWLLWVAVGFPQVTDPSPTSVAVAYAINIPLKVATFGLFAALVYAPRARLMNEPGPAAASVTGAGE